MTGTLVSDPAGRRISLNAAGRNVFLVPYNRIVGLHYERAEYPRRYLRRPSFYLVLHYVDPAGTPAAETIRILSERDALNAIATLQQHTGLRIDHSPATGSFLGLPIRVRVGSRVAITDWSGQTVKGTIAALSLSSVTLRPPNGGDQIFEARGVRKIRRLYSPRHDALLGLAGGAAVGVSSVWVAAGLGGCYGTATTDRRVARAMLGGAVIGGGLGALLGTTLGAVRYPFNSAFDAFHADRATAPPAPIVTIAPVIDRHTAGVTAMLTW